VGAHKTPFHPLPLAPPTREGSLRVFLSKAPHNKVFEIATPHSRERGNFGVFKASLDPRLRGGDGISDNYFCGSLLRQERACRPFLPETSS